MACYWSAYQSEACISTPGENLHYFRSCYCNPVDLILLTLWSDPFDPVSLLILWSFYPMIWSYDAVDLVILWSYDLILRSYWSNDRMILLIMWSRKHVIWSCGLSIGELYFNSWRKFTLFSVMSLARLLAFFALRINSPVLACFGARAWVGGDIKVCSAKVSLGQV